MTSTVDPPANPERDLARALASIGERRLRLDLTTLDVGFLALLHLRSGESQSTAFGEEQLFDAFEYACNALEPNAENVRTRATHTLRRLREQQLLTRVDSAGVACGSAIEHLTARAQHQHQEQRRADEPRDHAERDLGTRWQRAGE